MGIRALVFEARAKCRRSPSSGDRNGSVDVCAGVVISKKVIFFFILQCRVLLNGRGRHGGQGR